MWIIAIVIIIIALIGVMSWRRSQRKEIEQQRIVTAALPPDFARVTLLIVTDVKAFLRQSSKEKHDLVIVVDSLLTTALERKEQLLEIAKYGPTYYVWHPRDYEGNIQLADAHLREANIKILSDQWVRFEGESGHILQVDGMDGMGNVPVDYSFSEIVAHHKWLVYAKHDKIKLTNEYSLVLQPFCLTYRTQVGQMVEWTFERKRCAYSMEIVS